MDEIIKNLKETALDNSNLTSTQIKATDSLGKYCNEDAKVALSEIVKKALPTSVQEKAMKNLNNCERNK